MSAGKPENPTPELRAALRDFLAEGFDGAMEQDLNFAGFRRVMGDRIPAATTNEQMRAEMAAVSKLLRTREA